MSTKIIVVVGLLVLTVFIGAYLGYDYVKKYPPTWLVTFVTSTASAVPLPAGDQAPFSVPEGFVATIFSRETPGARAMARDPRGVLIVSLTQSGKIVMLPDTNSDFKADSVMTLLENLNLPHGLAFVCPQTG